jgi:hypothetical protein
MGTSVYFPDRLGGFSLFHCPDAEKNAALCAAAPDLLYALEVLLGKAYKQNFNDSYPEVVSIAESALAKARGEE